MATATNNKEKELEASKAAASDAYEKMLEAKNHFKLAAEAAGIDLKQDTLDQMLKGREKAEAVGNQVSTYVQEKPLTTLGVAFATGFVLSQLITRK